MKVCLVSSSGGHFEQLQQLKKLSKYDMTTVVVTEKTNIGEKADYYLKQVNRKEGLWLFYELINLFISIKILFLEKPDAVISTGALCTIPMLMVAKILRKKTIFIESFAKIDTPTLTGKLCYKFVDLFVVQWEPLLKIYPKAVLGGSIY